MRVKESKLHLTMRVFLFTLVLFSINVSIAAAASISGTIFQSDGSTPLTGENIWVSIILEDSCNENFVGGAQYNSTTGAYMIEDLAAGTYFLFADIDGNYVDEYWASSTSVKDCIAAESITITDEETLTGKNFQIDPGASISGTIFQSNGTTPLAGAGITVVVFINDFSGDHCNGAGYVSGNSYNTSDGTFTEEGLSAGTYFLRTSVYNGNYLDEWWASPDSIRDCSTAQSFTISDGETVTGKNFQLDPGGSISGTIYRSDGATPLTGECMYVGIYSKDNPCDINTGVLYKSTGYDANYSFGGLLPGTYYLYTAVEGDGMFCMGFDSLLNEWWASPASVLDCTNAQSIVITDTEIFSGIDFQLDNVIDPGDVNNDQKIDLTDMILISQIIAGINPTSLIFLEADVNGDGRIGIEEAVYVLEIITGLRE